jgi:anti-sigma factor RsiW
MSHHLSEETLLDYAHGRLSDDQERAVEAHFDTCKTSLAFVEEHLELQIAYTKRFVPIPPPQAGKKDLSKS